MSKKTAAGLVAWAEQAYAAGWVYWYGTCGYACTNDLLKRKTAQYPSHYKDSRQATYKKHVAAGKVCSDCIGLFKSYAWDKDGDIDTRPSSYGANEQPDHGAKTTLSKCKVKGPISTIPEIPGLAVWTSTGGHIGVYVGGGYVIELRGFSYGSQRNKLTDRNFTTWGLYPFAEYTPEQVAMAEAAAGGKNKPAEAPAQKVEETPAQSTEGSTAAKSTGKAVTVTLSTLRKGSKGDQVAVVQCLLNAMGYSCGAADGIFGDKTLAAVQAFQKAHGLAVDGIVGRDTWTALLT